MKEDAWAMESGLLPLGGQSVAMLVRQWETLRPQRCGMRLALECADCTQEVRLIPPP